MTATALPTLAASHADREGAARTSAPPEVTRLLAAGLRRAAAEWLADADLDGDIDEAAVTAALAEIAPHLTPDKRALVYGEDLKPWVDEVRYAYETGAPRARVGDADLDAQVQRCIDELVGGAL